MVICSFEYSYGFIYEMLQYRAVLQGSWICVRNATPNYLQKFLFICRSRMHTFPKKRRLRNFPNVKPHNTYSSLEPRVK